MLKGLSVPQVEFNRGKSYQEICILKKECVCMSVCLCKGDRVLYGNLSHK